MASEVPFKANKLPCWGTCAVGPPKSVLIIRWGVVSPVGSEQGGAEQTGSSEMGGGVALHPRPPDPAAPEVQMPRAGLCLKDAPRGRRKPQRCRTNGKPQRAHSERKARGHPQGAVCPASQRQARGAACPQAYGYRHEQLSGGRRQALGRRPANPSEGPNGERWGRGKGNTGTNRHQEARLANTVFVNLGKKFKGGLRWSSG